MKVPRLGIKTHVRLDHDAVAVVLPQGSDLAKPTHQTCAALPVELVEEILLRIPPDEPAHLVGIISDDTFCRRYRRFHGTPPLLGFICKKFFGDSTTVRFLPTTSVAATYPMCVPKLDYSSSVRSSALDCRHGRVLIETKDSSSLLILNNRRLVVWDPIAGSQQHVSLPTYPEFPYLCNYAGAVLCAKDGCDHLDCHGGPFLIVLVGLSYYDNDDEEDIADSDDEEDDVLTAIMYSSETGAWSAPTPNIINPYFVVDRRPSLLIGDALYFTTLPEECVIIKYDLHKNGLSIIRLPGQYIRPMLMKGDDGGLGVAYMSHSCIHLWSWRAGINGTDDWVKYRVMELDTLQIPRGGCQRGLICTPEGTNTIFIGIDKEIFMINLKSGQVWKMGQIRDNYCVWRILPYMRFATKY